MLNYQVKAKYPALLLLVLVLAGTAFIYWLSFKLKLSIISIVIILLPLFALVICLNWQIPQLKYLALASLLLLSTSMLISYFHSKTNLEGKRQTWEGRVVRSFPARNKAIVKLSSGERVQLWVRDSKFYLGQRIRANSYFQKPSPQRNPGGFDEALYLLAQRVNLKAERTQIYSQVDGTFSRLDRQLAQFRLQVIGDLEQFLQIENFALLKAICFADTKDIAKLKLAQFRIGGLGHILAVSGMHLMIMLLPLKLNYLRPYSFFLALLLICFWLILSGFRLSLLRASLMRLLVLANRQLGLRMSALNNTALIACLLLVFNPFLLLSQSFLYSFAISASIIIWHEEAKLYLKKFFKFESLTLFLDLLATVMLAQLAVLILNLGAGFSLHQLLLNLLTPVLLSLILFLVMLSFLLFLLLSSLLPLSWLLDFSLKTLKHLLALAADLVNRSKLVIYPSFILALILLFFFYFNWQKGYLRLPLKIHLLYFLALLVFLASSLLYIPKKGDVYFLDVGQGDCTVIYQEGRSIIIDGGVYDRAFDVILPFMNQQRLSYFDLAIVSHPHEDHIGGIIALCELSLVKKIVLPEIKQEIAALMRLRTIAQRQDIPILELSSRNSLEIARPWQVYWPKQTKFYTDLNESSLAIRADLLGISLLLTGDCPPQAENAIIKAACPPTTVLKVAHHGDKEACQAHFLEGIKPQLAVISVGKNNYGHPSRDCLYRLEQAKVQVLRTDKSGAIVLKRLGKEIEVKSYLSKEKIRIKTDG